jgi:hypothetical protein
MAEAGSPPSGTGVMLDAPWLGPSSPSSFEPQHDTCELASAQVDLHPAETACAGVKTETGLLWFVVFPFPIWPTLLRPQHQTTWFTSAHVWPLVSTPAITPLTEAVIALGAPLDELDELEAVELLDELPLELAVTLTTVTVLEPPEPPVPELVTVAPAGEFAPDPEWLELVVAAPWPELVVEPPWPEPIPPEPPRPWV